jgi:hypothetical protein
MNSTMITIGFVLIGYVATCMVQWRRLTRGEDKKHRGHESL